MKTPIPKRGWHIAQPGEYCPKGNTAAMWYGDKWDYNPIYGGHKYKESIWFPYSNAVRNHIRNT